MKCNWFWHVMMLIIACIVSTCPTWQEFTVSLQPHFCALPHSTMKFFSLLLSFFYQNFEPTPLPYVISWNLNKWNLVIVSISKNLLTMWQIVGNRVSSISENLSDLHTFAIDTKHTKFKGTWVELECLESLEWLIDHQLPGSDTLPKHQATFFVACNSQTSSCIHIGVSLDHNFLTEVLTQGKITSALVM